MLKIITHFCVLAISFPIVAEVSVQTLSNNIRGKTFADVVASAGFSKSETMKLVTDPIVPKKMSIIPGERFLVLRDVKSARTEARFYLDYTDEALVFWREGENVGVEKKPIHFEVIKKTVDGFISGSLIGSIRNRINAEWAAFRFSDAFSWDLGVLKKLSKRDSFKFTIEEKYDEGKFIKYGEILDAHLETGDRIYTRILWQNENAKVFVDPETRFEDRPFYAPVEYIRISSPFSKRRLHPVKRRYRPHLGVDFALYEGAPIFAARSGVITKVDKQRGNGKFVKIQHENEFYSIYNHLSRFADGIREGQIVKVGDVIGYVGCTGSCTNPHLHFSIRRGDYLYDPVYLTKPYPFKEKDYWKTVRFRELRENLASFN